MRTHRHPAFSGGPGPQPRDPNPDALTTEEVAAVEDALRAGGAPRSRLVRKMLRLAIQCPTAFQDGVLWASGKVVTKP